jgi:hypothetical protein
MRGSPLLRAILVLVAVAACGVGLARLTGSSSPPPAPPQAPAPAAEAPVPSRFHLVLSHSATSVRLDPGIEGKVVSLPAGPGPHGGSVLLDPAHPLLFIDVEWSGSAGPGGHRFAKLTLESPGQATLTRTFDATGDLSDVWEIDIE